VLSNTTLGYNYSALDSSAPPIVSLVSRIGGRVFVIVTRGFGGVISSLGSSLLPLSLGGVILGSVRCSRRP
jgi:hypothetical protein